MSARGLHVLMGGIFVHEFPGQCETCAERQSGKTDYRGWCAAREKTICCGKARKGGCKLYKPRDETPR